MSFPDVIHLKQLQKNLWLWPRSRASLMVGAGLSLNADPLPGVQTRFSTWQDLAQAMFDELHPVAGKLSELDAKRRDAQITFAKSDPLRIASEYEAAFDRQKLDALLRDRNPDLDYQPGALHRQLLQLPWADVFTTNYDTLLERTEVVDRSYHTVTKSNELISAFAPRIVKLHGSFPSQTPFIITEEDYRTYPKKFAPFVNSVQQSLLENCFVLIGFSGDDPNFLEWTGWIRDELGENHAPIYLVGPLFLEDARRSLLRRRGVTAIDLGTVFENLRNLPSLHRASLEWFIKCLSAARPARPETWPDWSRQADSAVTIPPVIGAVVIAEEHVDISPKEKVDQETAEKVLKRWRFERQQYPGWIVAPDAKRAGLWETTKSWLIPLIDFAKAWGPGDRLLLFREINWRIEKIMAPPFTDMIGPFREALAEAFSTLAAGGTIPPSARFREMGLTESDVTDSWMEICFGLLRDARESFDEARWNDLKIQVEQVAKHSPQHIDLLRYESALAAIWKLDRISTKKILSLWLPSEHSPHALMRKAGLLAELDELAEAKSLLRLALKHIRKAVSSHGRNIELLSMEGWCAFLIACIEPALNLSQFGAVRNEFRERWQELKEWDCDPWTYREFFEQVVSDSPPVRKTLESEVIGFDPGRITVSYSLASDSIGPSLPAFAFIRMHEQVGIPMRVQRFNIVGSTLSNACKWIAPFSEFWSPALLIRTGRFDDLAKGDFLTRSQVASMNSATAKRLYSWWLGVLERELAGIDAMSAMIPAQESLFKILPEVLSRLALKQDASELRRTLPVALRLHGDPAVQRNLGLDDCCASLFERLFEAADVELLAEWLPMLVKAPLPGKGDSSWPRRSDPLDGFPCDRIADHQKTIESPPTSITNATTWLLNRVDTESEEGRRAALNRLVRIHFSKLMTADQERQFGEVLWARRTESNIPDFPDLYVSAFVRLPAPAGVDKIASIKNHILSAPCAGWVTHPSPGGTSVAVAMSEHRFIREASAVSKSVLPSMRGEDSGVIEWTFDEAIQLYEKARGWWSNDRQGLQFATNSGFGDLAAGAITQTALRLGDFLSRIVLPRLETSDSNRWKEVLAWLQDIRSFEVFPTMALPYVLIRRPAEVDFVTQTVVADLGLDEDRPVSAASRALRHWSGLWKAGHVKVPPPRDAVDALYNRVLFRRKAGIYGCVWNLACLMSEIPEEINLAQAALLDSSLEQWHHATVLPSSGPGDFDEAERPTVRHGIAALAASLSSWYTANRGKEADLRGVTLWREICSKDPLPEIRRAFDMWDAK